MSIFKFDEVKKEKKVEVFYICGDQTPVFEWGYIIAQDMFSERGLNVFKTGAGKGNFMKDYNGESCVFVTGLMDQDMDLFEFLRFINGGVVEQFEKVDLSNVKVIITSRQMPLKWDFHDEFYQMDMLNSYDSIDHLYEVCTDIDDKVNIYEYEIEHGKWPERIKSHEDVDLHALSILQGVQSAESFEELPIAQYIEGPDEDKSKFMAEIDSYSAFEKRKICALFSLHYEPIPLDRARELVENLDYFDYLGYIHNFRDLGCYFIYEVNASEVIPKYSLYFDFETYAIDIDQLGKWHRAHLENITQYGYICGFDPCYSAYPSFDE